MYDRRTMIAGMAAWGVLSAPAARAQSRQTSIVVPYAPGGAHDAMARIVSGPMSERLGRTVIVENRPGAGGTVGADYVVHAKPDGSTILLAAPNEIVIAPSSYKTMRYDWTKDLLPVTLAGTTPIAIVANPSIGVRTLPEMLALARQKPEGLAFGSPGEGSSHHLAGAWLAQLASAKLVHVPYKGAGPATNDVVAGHIPLAIVGMASILPYVASGKLVVLAITSRTRLGWMKDLPTVAETPGLEGFEANLWEGIFVPAGTPDATVAAIQAAFADVLGQDTIRRQLRDAGTDAVGSSTADFRKFLTEDRARFARMFTYSGLQPE
jgi:tripartite-type tricarboxylate transporter receptor subunit TctC